MKVVFASCMDARKDPKQEVWNRALEQQPDVLLLLGDTIYMDYFPRLGKPRKWDSEKFLDEMYSRYSKQWQVDSFRRLVASVTAVGATWDDHDFAWNGAGGKAKKKKYNVPIDKMKISRGLYLQFLGQLRDNANDVNYPPKPSLDDLLDSGYEGIQECFDQGRVRFILLDGRSFRENKDHEEGTLLGKGQRDWLLEKTAEWDGLKLICTGSTLSRSGESWDKYTDYEWIMGSRIQNSIILSGDIHKNVFRKHRGGAPLVEATSSGAALPRIGGDVGNFGFLDILPDKVRVTLFDEDGPEIEKTVNF